MSGICMLYVGLVHRRFIVDGSFSPTQSNFASLTRCEMASREENIKMHTACNAVLKICLESHCSTAW